VNRLTTKFFVAALGLGLIACNPLDFTDLEDLTWVEPTSSSDSTDFGLAIVSDPANGGVVVTGQNNSAVVRVAYGSGEAKLGAAVIDPQVAGFVGFITPIAMDKTSNVVGVAGDGPSGTAFATERSAIAFPTTTAGEVAAVAMGVTDAGADLLSDGIAVRQMALVLFENYEGSNPGVSCDLPAIGTSLELAEANNDLTALELLVGQPDSVAIMSGSAIEAGGACAILGTLSPPSGETGFGQTLLVGDADGDSVDDLFVAAPDSNVVFFYSGGITDPANPPAPTSTLSDSGAVGSFGTSMALGDFNGDGAIDLAVGAPTAGAAGGGVVAIFESAAITGGFAATTVFGETDPAGGQDFGRAVGAARFMSKDVLVVSGDNQLWSYFRVFSDAVGTDSDPRQ
jgi:hypothetical protein